MEKKQSGSSPEELGLYLSEHSQYHAQYHGDSDHAEICCGQVAGLINEIHSAEEVVQDVIGNLHACIETLKTKLSDVL